MSENLEEKTIEKVFSDFVKELDSSGFSRNLINVYKELGIEP